MRDKILPMFKLAYEEYYERRSGDIVGSWTVYVRLTTTSEWIKLYTTFSENWAKIALRRLKELFDTQIVHFILGDKTPVMVERAGQIYAVEHMIPEQSCVVAKLIPRNTRYGEFNQEPEKFDYVSEILFFYYEGECLIKGNQVFLDGKLIMTSEELASTCSMIGQDMANIESSPHKLLDHLKTICPTIKQLECGYSTVIVD